MPTNLSPHSKKIIIGEHFCLKLSLKMKKMELPLETFSPNMTFWLKIFLYFFLKKGIRKGSKMFLEMQIDSLTWKKKKKSDSFSSLSLRTWASWLLFFFFSPLLPLWKKNGGESLDMWDFSFFLLWEFLSSFLLDMNAFLKHNTLACWQLDLRIFVEI